MLRKLVSGNTLILEKFNKKKLIINYVVKGEFNEQKQQVVFEFLDLNNQPIHKNHIKYSIHMILVCQQEVTQAKICISFSKGKGEIEIYYTYDNFFDESLPSKHDAITLNRKISEYTKDINKLLNTQKKLLKEEKKQFSFNERLDRKLIQVTIAEVLIIIFTFIMEFLVIKKYLKKRQLI